LNIRTLRSETPNPSLRTAKVFTGACIFERVVYNQHKVSLRYRLRAEILVHMSFSEGLETALQQGVKISEKYQHTDRL
jgi:hypothetical protein